MKNWEDQGAGAESAQIHGRRSLTEEQRLQRAYFRRRYAGGRNAFARILDYVALRGILFLCAYWLFLPRFGRSGKTLLLAAIALAIAMLILRMGREIAFERFVKKETARIRRALLSDALAIADPQTLIGLVSSLCPFGETPVALARALPIDADTLLEVVRKYRGSGAIHVFGCTGYQPQAVSLAERSNGLLTLHAPEELFAAAKRAGMEPDEACVMEYIASAERQRRRKRRMLRQQASPFAVMSGKKYFITALVLLGVSFLTPYALYYRMLSGLCMTIAAGSAAFHARSAHTA